MSPSSCRSRRRARRGVLASSLVFTPADALTPQTVTVTAMSNSGSQGSTPAVATVTVGPATSTDPKYNGLAGGPVRVGVYDDAPGLQVSSNSPLRTSPMTRPTPRPRSRWSGWAEAAGACRSTSRPRRQLQGERRLHALFRLDLLWPGRDEPDVLDRDHQSGIQPQRRSEGGHDAERPVRRCAARRVPDGHADAARSIHPRRGRSRPRVRRRWRGGAPTPETIKSRSGRSRRLRCPSRRERDPGGDRDLPLEFSSGR